MLAPALNLHATRKCQYGSALSELNMQTECQTPLTPDYTKAKQNIREEFGKNNETWEPGEVCKLCSCHILHFKLSSI